jgi:hypothetical protein
VHSIPDSVRLMLELPPALSHSVVQSGLSKMESRLPRELRETLGVALARTARVAIMRVLIIVMRVSRIRRGLRYIC